MFSSSLHRMKQRRFSVFFATATILALMAGCGARPETSKSSVVDAHAQLLPSGAPFVAVARPADLGAVYEHLSGGRVLSGLPIRFFRLPEALAFESTSRVWASTQLHGILAVRRAVEDAEKLLEEAVDRRALAPADQEGAPAAPGDPSVANWLASSPLPPVWTHTRLVGTPDSALDLVHTLGEAFGALQVTQVSDPSDALTIALGTDLKHIPEIKSQLSNYGVVRVIRLLSEELPTLVIESRQDGIRVIDLIQDQELGTHAISAAISTMVKPASSANRVASRLGSLRGSATVTMEIDHTAWSSMMRGLGEVLALQTVVTNSSLIGDGHSLLVRGRRLAFEPTRLQSLSASLFRSSLIEIEALTGGIRANLSVRYNKGSRWLSELTGGIAPVEHDALASLGQARISLALDPVRWRPAFEGKIPKAEDLFSVFLQRGLSCGLACFPAIWSALPVYGHDLNMGLASIFPELEPMKSAMSHVRSVAMVVDGQSGARRFAALLNFHGTQAVSEAAWMPLVKGLDNAWAGQGTSRSLLIGTASEAMGSLAKLRNAAAQRPAADVLRVSIGSGTKKAGTSRTDLSLRFNAEAMVLNFESIESVQTP